MKDAIQDNEEIKETQNTESAPTKKVEMGNLRKRKNASRTEDGGVIGAVG